jgi:hypothetical protein
MSAPKRHWTRAIARSDLGGLLGLPAVRHFAFPVVLITGLLLWNAGA